MHVGERERSGQSVESVRLDRYGLVDLGGNAERWGLSAPQTSEDSPDLWSNGKPSKKTTSLRRTLRVSTTYIYLPQPLQGDATECTPPLYGALAKAQKNPLREQLPSVQRKRQRLTAAALLSRFSSGESRDKRQR